MTDFIPASSRIDDDLRLPAGRSARWVNLALAVVSVLLSFGMIELGYRVYAGLPVLSIKDWRTEQAVINKVGDRALLDPILGWTLKPWHKGGGHTTIDHGVRRNFDEAGIRAGGILAVGDSFTEGWQVSDSKSWPAILERAIGVPVINAGVGGYGTDQIVLRAEQLLPIVRPRILIVGFLDLDIFRSGHSYFGAPKPHFTTTNGALRFHPPQVSEPRPEPGLSWTMRYLLRDALGRFAVADFLLGRLAPSFWYATGDAYLLRRADNDAVAVTCALLARLKQRTESDAIRMLLFMQHDASALLAGSEPTDNARRVVDCAHAAGIEIVDQFWSLHELIAIQRNRIGEYYFPAGPNQYWHMTEKGNAQAAALIAEALRR
jgi:hypothetical protein